MFLHILYRDDYFLPPRYGCISSGNAIFVLLLLRNGDARFHTEKNDGNVSMLAGDDAYSPLPCIAYLHYLGLALCISRVIS